MFAVMEIHRNILKTTDHRSVWNTLLWSVVSSAHTLLAVPLISRASVVQSSVVMHYPCAWRHDSVVCRFLQ